MRAFRVWSFRIGTRLMCWAGDEGSAEWNRMADRAQQSERNYFSADRERWRWIDKFFALQKAAKLVDGLMSSGKTTEAQQQLRVALIASGESFGKPAS